MLSKGSDPFFNGQLTHVPWFRQRTQDLSAVTAEFVMSLIETGPAGENVPRRNAQLVECAIKQLCLVPDRVVHVGSSMVAARRAAALSFRDLAERREQRLRLAARLTGQGFQQVAVDLDDRFRAEVAADSFEEIADA